MQTVNILIYIRISFSMSKLTSFMQEISKQYSDEVQIFKSIFSTVFGYF